VSDNIAMWNIYKTLLPSGGEKLRMVIPAPGEPYYTVAQELSRMGHTTEHDIIQVVVGDDYTPQRQARIKSTIMSKYLPGVKDVEILVQDRAVLPVSATKMCQKIDGWWEGDAKDDAWAGDFTPVTEFLPPELNRIPVLQQTFLDILKKKTKKG